MGIMVTDVSVLNNPTNFSNPFQFEISFECTAALQEDVEWKLLYVGSPESDAHDQKLDCVEVGPLQPGFMKFVFQAEPPQLDKIPVEDLLGVTAILLSCSYREKEFIQIGYYVSNRYNTEELQANPPQQPDPTQIIRHIMDGHPRITKWQIGWDEPTSLPEMPPVQEEDMDADLMEDEDMMESCEEEEEEENDQDINEIEDTPLECDALSKPPPLTFDTSNPIQPGM